MCKLNTMVRKNLVKKSLFYPFGTRYISDFIDQKFYTVEKFCNCVGHCDLHPIPCFT